MRALVTGGTGFVGRALCEALTEAGIEVTVAARSAAPQIRHRVHIIGDLGLPVDWRSALRDVDVVFHLAARVHVADTRADGSLFHQVNTVATESLGKTCSAVGVRRVIYLSTVKVYGESCEKALSPGDQMCPVDDYARSKANAEGVLQRIAADGTLDVTIVRPPLIYGPGVKANFLRLMQLVDSGIPLPFDRIRNRRSFVFVNNLCSFLIKCATEARSSGRIFLVSDEQDVSTPELIRQLAFALRVRPRLIPVPLAVLRGTARVFGRGDKAKPLIGSLYVDTAATRDLGWSPPWSLQQGLEDTATHFRKKYQ